MGVPRASVASEGDYIGRVSAANEHDGSPASERRERGGLHRASERSERARWDLNLGRSTPFRSLLQIPRLLVVVTHEFVTTDEHDGI
ncbi:hypothetical protein [Haloarchaeobius salinus]|uniref:hypothetical protein n=1 Tax=Haloarchaeobius salinus TaxID=1198298 RepID=UPI00210C4DEE|nr:hypothetical protein [Haloarchaeobius salinus]